jgi:hypothetical protein
MLALTQLVGFGGGAGGPIALTESGTTTSVANTATIVFTVPAGGIPAGAAIFIIASNGGSLNLSSVLDSKTSATYTVDDTATVSRELAIASAPNTSGLVSGDTITATFSGADTGKGMWVGYATGMATSSILDQHTSATNTSTTPSATTSATTHAADLVLAAVKTSSIVTEDAAFTGLTEVALVAGKFHPAYKIVAATGAQTYAPTQSGSVAWRDTVCAYKGA